MNQIELDELRNFYKNEQGDKVQKTPEEFWENEVQKMFEAFKEKIINKDFTVGTLNPKYNKNDLDKYIKVAIDYDLPNAYAYIKIDKEDVQQICESDRPNEFINRVRDLIKKEFGFSKVGIEYSYKRNDIFGDFSLIRPLTPWNALEPHFILNFRV